MKILALEFSSPQRSVAVVSASKDTISASQVVEAAVGNTMRPFSMVEEALHQAGLEREQIECLAVGLGPGSYNGIRTAIALAQGWQLASDPHGLKIVGVSSEECIAAQARVDGLVGKVSVVIDAQREEFYLAGYEISAGNCRQFAALQLAKLDEVRKRGQAGEILIGPEVARWFANGRVVFPRAAMLGQLALSCQDFIEGERLEPNYLRQTKFVKAPPPLVFPRVE